VVDCAILVVWRLLQQQVTQAGRELALLPMHASIIESSDSSYVTLLTVHLQAAYIGDLLLLLRPLGLHCCAACIRLFQVVLCWLLLHG
jgi:hypothetical protein